MVWLQVTLFTKASENDIIESTINFLVFSEEIRQNSDVKVSAALEKF